MPRRASNTPEGSQKRDFKHCQTAVLSSVSLTQPRQTVEHSPSKLGHFCLDKAGYDYLSRTRLAIQPIQAVAG